MNPGEAILWSLMLGSGVAIAASVFFDVVDGRRMAREMEEAQRAATKTAKKRRRK